jgi:L-alanine-DL-glutamate epimerase-like enolase superfamily enzyme
MKVTGAKAELFTRDSPAISSTASVRFRPAGVQYLAVLRLHTDEGIEGNTFIGAGTETDVRATAAQAVSLVTRELVGRDAADREWLWSQLRTYTFYGRLSYLAWSAVDVALWDIAGKAADAPVYKLLGANSHSTRVYASSPYYPTAQGYADEALKYKAAGFAGYKIHPAGVPVSRVKEVATRVREAAGDEMALMMDTSLCYDYEQALEIGKHLQDLGYAWFEDPVRYSDFDAVDELARRLDIPIAVTDHPAFGFHEAAQMIRRRNGVRIIRGDAMKEGITGLKKLCGLAEGFALKCEVHSSVNSPMNIANLHVVLSVPNCDYFELIVPPDNFQYGMKQDITVGPDGLIQAPTRPGLGLEIDWELIGRRSAGVIG